MDLPQLSESVTLYSDCCCPLSKPLIFTLASSLPSQPGLIISIGSGSGLFEAYLLRESCQLNIHGVEVSGSINRYLPNERMHLVRGTWDLASLAKDALVWMFVYPRDLLIIKRYFQVYGMGAVRRIIWIGPLADLEELETVLSMEGWDIGPAKSIGHSSAVLQMLRNADVG